MLPDDTVNDFKYILYSLSRTTWIIYVLVWPFGAVTVTYTSLFPTCKCVVPLVTTVASGSSVVYSKLISSYPWGIVTKYSVVSFSNSKSVSTFVIFNVSK